MRRNTILDTCDVLQPPTVGIGHKKKKTEQARGLLDGYFMIRANICPVFLVRFTVTYAVVCD